jgi:hypothetical protein
MSFVNGKRTKEMVQMLSKRRNLLAVGAAVLVAVVGSAGAIAATGALSPEEESQAVLEDAAERLGVQPSELTAALKAALKARVDAAVAAGRLTEAEATELKERIDSDDVPLFGLARGAPGHVHFGHFGGLDAAASYLGVTEAALRAELAEGQTLAEVAKAKGKSVDGLVDALVAEAKQDLEQAVADGRLTDAQRDDIVATLEERITAMVNGEHRPGPGLGMGPPQLDGLPGAGLSFSSAATA